LPGRGTLELIERIELHIGGNAANTAASMGKLGVDVALCGQVGSDLLGDVLVDQLRKSGVDTTPVVRDPSAPSAASLVTIHADAERSFLHAAGANATFRADGVVWERLDGARALHVAGLQLLSGLEGEPIQRVLAEAKRRGMLTSLDTVMNPRSAGLSGVSPALPFLDWFVPSVDEAAQLSGIEDPRGQIAFFRARGARGVAIKRGAAGCVVAADGGEPVDVAPFSVEVVDTLGAGDAWCAGFVSALVRGESPVDAGRWGNAVGACCVTALGATTGIVPLADIAARFGLSTTNLSAENLRIDGFATTGKDGKTS
jgi:sugar/nucleoside kinase (ribokinase family)